MTPRTRLKILAVFMVLTSIYAYLVAFNEALARTVALGYIAIMLTVLVIISCWKKPHV